MSHDGPIRAHHTVIIGDSGSGKTTKAREIHKKDGLISVFIHPPESKKNNVAGIERKTAEGLLKAIRKGHDRISFVCNNPAKAAYIVKQVGIYCNEYFNHVDAEVIFQIVVDEAKHYIPDDDTSATDNDMKWILHEGRDKRIRLVMTEQDPQELDYTPLKQCEYIVWCGAPNTFHEGFIRFYGLQDVKFPRKDFEYMVISPELDDEGEPTIVDRGKTQKKFS